MMWTLAIQYGKLLSTHRDRGIDDRTDESLAVLTDESELFISCSQRQASGVDYSGVPREAIAACLDVAGIALSDVGRLAVVADTEQLQSFIEHAVLDDATFPASDVLTFIEAELRSTLGRDLCAIIECMNPASARLASVESGAIPEALVIEVGGGRYAPALQAALKVSGDMTPISVPGGTSLSTMLAALAPLGINEAAVRSLQDTALPGELSADQGAFLKVGLDGVVRYRPEDEMVAFVCALLRLVPLEERLHRISQLADALRQDTESLYRSWFQTLLEQYPGVPVLLGGRGLLHLWIRSAADGVLTERVTLVMAVPQETALKAAIVPDASLRKRMHHIVAGARVKSRVSEMKTGEAVHVRPWLSKGRVLIRAEIDGRVIHSIGTQKHYHFEHEEMQVPEALYDALVETWSGNADSRASLVHYDIASAAASAGMIRVECEPVSASSYESQAALSEP